jgi:type VI secretion system lysozyme-like protein
MLGQEAPGDLLDEGVAVLDRHLEQLDVGTALHFLGEEERTVINYGIPDFTSLSPQSGNDRKLIADIISQTVAAYEPRLRNVRVNVEDYEENERTLQVTLEADLVTEAVVEIRSHPEFGTSLEPVTFPIILYSKTGILEV